MNCKFCGRKLTKKNSYSTLVCNDKHCLWQHLKVCCEDCFNCTYHDCIVDEKSISNNAWDVELMEKKRVG